MTSGGAGWLWPITVRVPNPTTATAAQSESNPGFFIVTPHSETGPRLPARSVDAGHYEAMPGPWAMGYGLWAIGHGPRGDGRRPIFSDNLKRAARSPQVINHARSAAAARTVIPNTGKSTVAAASSPLTVTTNESTPIGHNSARQARAHGRASVVMRPIPTPMA